MNKFFFKILTTFILFMFANNMNAMNHHRKLFNRDGSRKDLAQLLIESHARIVDHKSEEDIQAVSDDFLLRGLLKEQEKVEEIHAVVNQARVKVDEEESHANEKHKYLSPLSRAIKKAYNKILFKKDEKKVNEEVKVDLDIGELEQPEFDVIDDSRISSPDTENEIQKLRSSSKATFHEVSINTQQIDGEPLEVEPYIEPIFQSDQALRHSINTIEQNFPETNNLDDKKLDEELLNKLNQSPKIINEYDSGSSGTHSPSFNEETKEKEINRSIADSQEEIIEVDNCSKEQKINNSKKLALQNGKKSSPILKVMYFAGSVAAISILAYLIKAKLSNSKPKEQNVTN